MTNQIKPSVTNPTIADIYQLIDAGKLVLRPDFQRKFVWTHEHQEDFIDTISPAGWSVSDGSIMRWKTRGTAWRPWELRKTRPGGLNALLTDWEISSTNRGALRTISGRLDSRGHLESVGPAAQRGVCKALKWVKLTPVLLSDL